MSLLGQFELFMYVVIPIYLTAFIIYAMRAFRGPTTLDIILAVDCLSFDVAAFMALLAIYFRSAFLVTGAIILSLWAYLLDIYISKYYVSREVGIRSTCSSFI